MCEPRKLCQQGGSTRHDVSVRWFHHAFLSELLKAGPLTLEVPGDTDCKDARGELSIRANKTTARGVNNEIPFDCSYRMLAGCHATCCVPPNRPEKSSKCNGKTSFLPHAFANASQPDEIIARLSTFQPAIPLGPVEVLKGYEEV